MKNIEQKYNTNKKDILGNDQTQVVTILNIPETLQELQSIASDKEIVKIVVNHVIYHTLLTRVRKAYDESLKNESKKQIFEVNFSSGFDKQERTSNEKSKALKQLKNLSVEQLQKILASL